MPEPWIRAVRCRSCKRVFIEGRMPPVDGECVICAGLHELMDEMKHKESVRRVRRNCQRGFGPPKPGEDV